MIPVKTRKAVLFGATNFAQVAKFYLTVDSPYEVVAFCINRDKLSGDEFDGLPLRAFEDIEQHYPPQDHDFFVAVGSKAMNGVRERLMREARAKGYHLLTYVCSKATSWGDTKLGDNVFIFENNVIQPFVSIGEGTVLWSGNHIGHHSTIGPYCFITSHVVISGYCKVGAHTFMGVNSTVSEDVEIGARNLIGPNTLIQKATLEGEVYIAERTKKFPKDSSRFFR